MSERGALRRLARRAEELHRELFFAPWRAGLRQEAGRQEDVFLAVLFLEGVGVDSPASYYLLEVYPQLAERFHQWHRRMGVDRLDGAGMCC